MSLFDVKRKLTARSDRVKCIDIHSTEPWIVASLYNGNVHFWNYESQSMTKTLEICTVPIRAVKFVPRKNWVITGSDDLMIRVYNYINLEKIKEFEAHSDYIRSMDVHASQPLLLTCSDDQTIKLWNWDKSWECIQSFEKHSHYIMQILFNPKDNNTFASASLDKTIKVWHLGSRNPNFSLEGHTRGVNTISYYHGPDKPYIISGSDDFTAKIWDYHNKSCVHTISGHVQNISAVYFHSELPVIITGSEDGTVKLWNSRTYRMEKTLNYGMDRIWTIAGRKNINEICMGFDSGTIVVKMGQENPMLSMDSNGKVVCCKNNDILQSHIKVSDSTKFEDGQLVDLSSKNIGTCEIYPHFFKHNSNGRFIGACGNGEYVVYSSMALRNTKFGPASKFVWGCDSSTYAVFNGSSKITIVKNFKEKCDYTTSNVDEIYGGTLLGIKSSDTLTFYTWETFDLVRQIDVEASNVIWSENNMVVISSKEDSFYILRYDENEFNECENVPENGVESSFEILHTVEDSVTTGVWCGAFFVYTNFTNRLNYFVGGHIITIAHLDRQMYILGYLAKHCKVYLSDKNCQIVGYQLLNCVLDYQSAVLKNDFEAADTHLVSIPMSHRNSIAEFLHAQNFKKQALAVATDLEFKFILALEIEDIELSYDLAKQLDSKDNWMRLSEVVERSGHINILLECLEKMEDLPGQFFYAKMLGSKDMLAKVAKKAYTEKHFNITFISYFISGRLDDCIELFIDNGRFSEAAIFARTYAPSRIVFVTNLWKKYIDKSDAKLAKSIATPDKYPNLFPEYQNDLMVEQFQRIQLESPMKSSNHDLKNDFKEAISKQIFTYDPNIFKEMNTQFNNENIEKEIDNITNNVDCINVN